MIEETRHRLVITRRKGQALHIFAGSKEIILRVQPTHYGPGYSVQIEAPRSVRILREELLPEPPPPPSRRISPRILRSLERHEAQLTPEVAKPDAP